MSQFLRNSLLMVLMLTPIDLAISFLLFPSCNIKEIPYLCDFVYVVKMQMKILPMPHEDGAYNDNSSS